MKNGTGDDFRLMTRVLPRPLVLQGGKSFAKNTETEDRKNVQTETSFATFQEMLPFLPMGDKSFILPLKLDLRKRLKIKEGDTLKIQLQVDLEEYQPDTDLVEALTYDPKASSFFYGHNQTRQ